VLAVSAALNTHVPEVYVPLIAPLVLEVYEEGSRVVTIG